MNKNLSDQEIIDFLKAYPESIPSQYEKARTVQRVSREIRKKKANSTGVLDFLFAGLFIPLLLLALFYGSYSAAFGEQILRQIFNSSFIKPYPVCIWMAWLLVVPMLLTIIPLNRGGFKK